MLYYKEIGRIMMRAWRTICIVRDDKAATARKTGGKPKSHREFRKDYFRGGNAPASLKLLVGALLRGEAEGISGVETPRPH